jgi:hypothetical protein
MMARTAALILLKTMSRLPPLPFGLAVGFDGSSIQPGLTIFEKKLSRVQIARLLFSVVSPLANVMDYALVANHPVTPHFT